MVGYRVFHQDDASTPCCLPTLPFRWEDGRATALDGAFATAFAVNERGQVLGWRVTQAPAPWGGDQIPEGPLTIEAVVWQPDGEVVAAPADAHVTTDVWDINDQGQALVDVDADGNEPTGGSIAPAIWEVGGGVTELGTLGGTNSWGAAINERGWVAGTSQTADFSERAFLWRDGRLIDLGDLGGGSSAVGHRDRNVFPSFASPSDDDDVLNERGHVVGTSTTATGEGPHAFLWRDGEMTDLGVPPGGALPFPEAINDHDQVVGSYFRPEDRTRHAFLWQDGQMIDLGALAGADASEATDINDQGQISGFVSTDEDGDGFHETSRPVMWTVRPGAGGAT